MNPDSDNVPVDPNIFEWIITSIVTLPPVPPWVEWGAIVFTFAAPVVVLIVMYVWRHWLADWSARRSATTAYNRAIKEKKHICTLHRLHKDPSAAIAASAHSLFLVGSALASILLALLGIIFLVVGSPLGTPLTDGERTFGIVAASGFWLAGCFLILLSWYSYSKWVSPLDKLDPRTKRTRELIERLLKRAGRSGSEHRQFLEDFDREVRAAGCRRRLDPPNSNA